MTPPVDSATHCECDDGPENCEIEITPEMIEVGIREYALYDLEDPAEWFIPAIYRAMASKAKETQSS